MKPDQSVCCVEDIVNQLRPILSHKTLDNVIQLLALLFVLPCSSATAERSFSALRRLKTYLRSTMSAERLNSICVFHVHKELTDDLNIGNIMQDFICANDKRKLFFGHDKSVSQ